MGIKEEPEDTIANTLTWTLGFTQLHVDTSDASFIDCLFLPFLICKVGAFEDNASFNANFVNYNNFKFS